jgi:hypothetical protein
MGDEARPGASAGLLATSKYFSDSEKYGTAVLDLPPTYRFSERDDIDRPAGLWPSSEPSSKMGHHVPFLNPVQKWEMISHFYRLQKCRMDATNSAIHGDP